MPPLQRNPEWLRWLRSGRLALTVLVLAAMPFATFVAGIRVGSAEPVAALIAAADGDPHPTPKRVSEPPVVLVPEPFIAAHVPKGSAAAHLHLQSRT